MTTSTFVAVAGLPAIHTTPLARIVVENSKAIVELDDLNERRVRLIFWPYQAVRIITADCFESSQEDSLLPNVVSERRSSPWIQKLLERQRRIDATARFMEKARHFLVPLQDDFLEVIAWDVAWEVVEPPT